jgi:hypothetical protein
MNTRLLKLNYLGLAAAIVLTACSGGDVNISAKGPTVQPFPNNPPASSSEAITTHGVITALSDVTVNGVRYDAGGAATVTYNGEPGTLSDLRRGQVVTVSGRINSNGFSGSANSIRYDANLIGPVESLDAAEHRLIVMGQTVMAGPDAVFASGINPETFAGLSAGSIIQVSGFTDASGAIRATRIDQDRLATELQVIGRVDSLDLANLLFTIDRLTVDYSSAIVIDLPGGAPATGMRVKAIGTLSSGLFRVERLASAPALAGSTGRRVQVAGLITRFSSRGDFDIGGSSAAVAAGTAFLNGHADDLRLNAEVVIDGDFASNGRISANRVTFERLASATDNLVYAFRDFTEISVPTVFSVTVTQGPEFSVEVAVDEDAAHRIEVTQTGSRLNFALTMGDGRIDRLEAFVTMPMLERIDLTGVTNARLIDFDQAQMTVNVGGVSRLHGEGLVIDELTATVSGVSLLDFGNIRPIRRANINVGGVSQATLNMDIGATLTGSVSTGQGTGFSTLFYYGTNATLNVARDSSSSVVRLGDTRP